MTSLDCSTMGVSDRIRKRMGDLDLKAVNIVERTKAAKSSVSGWVNGVSEPSSKNMLKLCGVLECSPEWLLRGDGTPPEPNKPPLSKVSAPVELRRVPLISLAQATKWVGKEETLDYKKVKEWPVIDVDAGPNAFAVKVKGGSVVNPTGFPSIPEGYVVATDPDIVAKDGDIVVAELRGYEDAVIKKLVIDGPNKYLESLNPDYKMIPIDDDNSKIIGTALIVSFYLRK